MGSLPFEPEARIAMRRCKHAVIRDDDDCDFVFIPAMDSDLLGVALAFDIGDALTQGPGEGCLDPRRKRT
jgi:hypothetical protein